MSDTDLLSNVAAPDADSGTTSGASPESAEVPAAGAPAENGSAPRRRTGLSSMVLADLRELAGQLGITDTAGMRKGDLIAAIKQRQEGGQPATEQLPLANPAAAVEAPAQPAGAPAVPAVTQAPVADRPVDVPVQRPVDEASTARVGARRRVASRPAGSPSPRETAEDTGPAAVLDTGGPAVDDMGGDAAVDTGRMEQVPPAQAQHVEQAEPVAAEPQRTEPAEGAGQTERVDQTERADLTEQQPRTERADRGDRQDRGDRDRGDRDRADRDRADRDRADRDRGDRADRSDRDRGDRADRDRGDRADRDRGDRADRSDRDRTDRDRADRDRTDRDRTDRDRGDRDRVDRAERTDRDRGDRADRDRGDRSDRDRGDRGDGRRDRQGQQGDRDRDGQANGQRAAQAQGPDDDDDDGGRGRRGRRFRDRRRNRGDRRPEGAGGEPEVREDDVLLPVAGILDVLENYAFVRTTGYLSGPNDVYVSLSLVRKYGLRRGDAITGAVRQQRDGEQQRQKFNPLVRVDTVNGMDVEAAKERPEFTKLTPLYPNERLRLETEPHILTTRVIDLVMPIGKGQRALIVSPPKAGKTMILQAIANAITTNNPECHLMVVLVDERPEEVTDMQRSVKGEVIASTFDRPPSDHTTVSELAIERAKRLVEMGHDVVVLLDSITRLGRAYNLAAPASGRILSGGVDSTALYPPKRFLGAARNIENGGSLTIFATALVETGSTMDTVIFEEFKGTGNAELKLDRKIADKRVFPAIDIDPSGTRMENLLLAPEEYAIVVKLRKVLHSLDSPAALDLLLDKLKQTRTNIEFLKQIQKTTPGE